MNQKMIITVIAIILVGVGGYALGTMQRSAPQGTATPTTQPTVTPTTTILATPSVPGTTSVKVYLFSNTLYNTPGSTVYWQPAVRSTTRSDVAAFTVEEIIKGPSELEKTQGFAPTFGTGSFATFADESNCAGKDFTISIVNTIATVKFCKGTLLSGDMSGFIISGQIVETLKQFPSIQKVTILSKTGACFNDMKGSGECTY